MKPKKSLGQNFLTSIPARIAIVKAGNLTDKDIVLEIGPGQGFLTEEILKTGAKVIALEKDKTLIPLLEQKFHGEIKNKQLILLEGDALMFDISKHKKSSDSFKLIANIPYYITGAILSKYLSAKVKPSQMVVLVQKEVALRVVARDKKESILSMSVKVYGDAKIVYKVNKGSFYPVPSVDSAVLSIENISNKNFKNKTEEDSFFELLKLGFSHKRKLLISNLSEKKDREELEEIFDYNKIPLKSRAEELKITDWLNISRKK